MNNPDPRQVLADLHALARENFSFFVERAFRELYDKPYLDNWHIHVIAYHLTRVMISDERRLIIAVPPRHLKSFTSSICYPAWVLGHKPGERIVCASYAQPVSEEFGFETRKLMQTDWYRRVFPNTHLDPRKCSARLLTTTRGGQRRATSVGGAMTGLGGDFIIIDDAIKAADAHSEVVRQNAIDWFRGTVTSRLDTPKKGRIVIIAQRLHMDDLPGLLLASPDWTILELPLVEWKLREIEVAPGKIRTRPPGDILHEERMGEAEIAQYRRDMGERDFEAQYNQRPLPPGGALFKLKWLKRFDQPPKPRQIEGIFQSWDTAYDIEDHNDYSVCTTWALSGKRYYLLDVFRDRLEFPDLEKAIYTLRKNWKADLVIVEKAGSGISIAQNIRRETGKTWLHCLTPAGSKQDRASQQTPRFERGEIWVPTEARWLKAFEDELASFPHGKHDDQVDSVVQFLAAVDTGRLLLVADNARRR